MAEHRCGRGQLAPEWPILHVIIGMNADRSLAGGAISSQSPSGLPFPVAQLMTLWKTVLYWLNDLCRPAGHRQEISLLPNSHWPLH